MSKQIKPVPTPDDLTETTEAADIELQEQDLQRVAGGTDQKFQPFK